MKSKYPVCHADINFFGNKLANDSEQAFVLDQSCSILQLPLTEVDDLDLLKGEGL
jgi:hypothetical protein